METDTYIKKHTYRWVVIWLISLLFTLATGIGTVVNVTQTIIFVYFAIMLLDGEIYIVKRVTRYYRRIRKP
jgi:hypothetical protein